MAVSTLYSLTKCGILRSTERFQFDAKLTQSTPQTPLPTKILPPPYPLKWVWNSLRLEFMFDKETCLLVDQEDMSFCRPRRHVF